MIQIIIPYLYYIVMKYLTLLSCFLLNVLIVSARKEDRTLGVYYTVYANKWRLLDYQLEPPKRFHRHQSDGYSH